MNVRFGVLIVALTSSFAFARDPDRRYANSTNKEWFHSLATAGGGRCCDEADGTGVDDIDWDLKDGHYRVRIEGEWTVVPDNRIVQEPNRIGRAVVWTYYQDGHPVIRCFMRGSLS
jgi:hypothetical protein